MLSTNHLRWLWGIVLLTVTGGCAPQGDTVTVRAKSRASVEKGASTASTPPKSTPTLFAKHEVDYGGDIVFVDASPNGQEVVSVDQQGRVKVWEKSTGREKRAFGLSSQVDCAAISPDRNYICLGNQSYCMLFKLADGSRGPVVETIQRFPEGGHCSLGTIMQIQFSHDSKWLLCGGKSTYFSGNEKDNARLDHALWIWSLDDLEHPIVLRPGVMTLGSRCAAFLLDGSHAVSCNREEKLYLWNLETKSLAKTIPLKGSVELLTPLGKGKEFAVMISDNVGRIGKWNVEETEEATEFEVAEEGDGRALAASADGSLVAAGYWFQSGEPSRPVVLWNAATGKIVARLTGHSRMPLSLSFSADGSELFAGLAGGEIHCWQVSKE